MICILQSCGPIRVLIAAGLIDSGPIETSPRRSRSIGPVFYVREVVRRVLGRSCLSIWFK